MCASTTSARHRKTARYAGAEQHTHAHTHTHTHTHTHDHLCQIRKDVKFSLTLDVFELCSPALQAKLKAGRNELRAEARNVDELGKLVVAKVQTIDGITRTLTCPVVHI